MASKHFFVLDSNGQRKITPYTSLTLPVPVASGGTGLTTVNAGDLLYASAPNVISALPIGTGIKLMTNYGGIPSWQDVSSGVIPSIPRSTTRKPAFSIIRAGNASGSFSDVGWVSAAGSSTISTLTDTVSVWSRTITNTTPGNAAGHRLNDDWAWIDHAPRFQVRIRTGSITNVRYYFMIVDNSVTGFPSNSDDLHTLKGFGLRYSTVAGDAGWMLWSSDGTTQTIGAKVANIAANSIYTLSAYVDSDIGHFNCDVNGTALNGVVPAGMLATTMRANCCVITTDAVAKTVDMSAMYGEWN